MAACLRGDLAESAGSAGWKLEVNEAGCKAEEATGDENQRLLCSFHSS